MHLLLVLRNSNREGLCCGAVRALLHVHHSQEGPHACGVAPPLRAVLAGARRALDDVDASDTYHLCTEKGQDERLGPECGCDASCHPGSKANNSPTCC